MIQGSCHCGRVSWTLNVVPENALSCNCTVCRRFGVLWAYGILDQSIITTGETCIYQREGGGNVEFHFCKHCGCLTHYIAKNTDDSGQKRAAVNLRMAEMKDIFDIPVSRFDGHETWSMQPDDGRTIADHWY